VALAGRRTDIAYGHGLRRVDKVLHDAGLPPVVAGRLQGGGDEGSQPALMLRVRATFPQETGATDRADAAHHPAAFSQPERERDPGWARPRPHLCVLTGRQTSTEVDGNQQCDVGHAAQTLLLYSD